MKKHQKGALVCSFFAVLICQAPMYSKMYHK
ncbi:hypothetical protein BSNT_09832 [Bacillus subtilis subsp. natto BEST195]|nr:hypothetical protein BSNT_09832 [Bacillus subtilis subsp. natto BEST195]